jgi:hypothetical protein
MGMGKLKIIISAAVIVCSMLGSSNNLLAQDAQSGPTDSDLKAAYCLSVVQGQEATMHPCGQTFSESQWLTEYFAKACHEDQDKIARLKDYLTARGYMTGERDSMPAVVAADRGHTDYKDCDQFVTSHRGDLEACSKRCETQADKDACFNACPVPESCRRIRSCKDLSFLPF